MRQSAKWRGELGSLPGLPKYSKHMLRVHAHHRHAAYGESGYEKLAIKAAAVWINANCPLSRSGRTEQRYMGTRAP